MCTVGVALRYRSPWLKESRREESTAAAGEGEARDQARCGCGACGKAASLQGDNSRAPERIGRKHPLCTGPDTRPHQ